MPKHKISIWDRQRRKMVEEIVPAGRLLAAAYHPAIYFWLGRLLYKHVGLSRILGKAAKTKWSRKRIRRFVRRYNIDLDECLESVEQWRSFNDFFIRRLKRSSRPVDENGDRVVSPADCRALFFSSLNSGDHLRVKGLDFTLCQLIGGREELAEEFAGGAVMIGRLSPVDCHRFYYPAAGEMLESWDVPGGYDSVHPIALRRYGTILAENCRRVTLMNLSRRCRALMVEVGAFAVADIVQTHPGGKFEKMQEKGYFNLGGSTVVLIISSGQFTWDGDLLERSEEGVESRLRFGEGIGGAVK